jgi:hypothetical protein
MSLPGFQAAIGKGVSKLAQTDGICPVCQQPMTSKQDTTMGRIDRITYVQIRRTHGKDGVVVCP